MKHHLQLTWPNWLRERFLSICVRCPPSIVVHKRLSNRNSYKAKQVQLKSIEDPKFKTVMPNTTKAIFAWDKEILSYSKYS